MRRLYLRILLYVVALLLLLQAAIIGIFVAMRAGRVSKVAHDHLLALGRYLGDEIQKTPPGKLGERVRELGSRLRLRISVRDAAGTLRYRQGDALPAPGPGELAGVAKIREPDRQGRTFATTIPLGDGGTLRLAPNAPPFEPAIAEHVFLFAGLLGLMALSLLPLARYITRPLRELEAAAKAIAAGDLSRRAKVTTRDEIGALARAFNEMAERIALSIRQEKDLVTGISHELRAPLARLRLANELLVDTEEASRANTLRLTEKITEEIEELDGLIEELLTRARLESTAFSLEQVSCDISEVVREAALRAAPVDDPQRVVLDLSEKPIGIRGNRALLNRAFRNLLANALQYSDTSKPVKISIAASDAKVVVNVADEGVGIPPGEIERVFEPFFRGERSRSRRTGGVGFGLALARQIVRRHGGEITLDSEVGRGTIVSVILPTGGGADGEPGAA